MAYLATNLNMNPSYFFKWVSILRESDYLIQNFLHSWNQRPEFTFAAVSLLVIGCLICFTNLQFCRHSPLASCLDSVGDMSNRAQGWILWISLGVKCTDGLISLLPAAFEHFTDALEPHRRNYMPIGEYYSHETETEVRLVPTSWVLYGLWSALSLVLYWSGCFCPGPGGLGHQTLGNTSWFHSRRNVEHHRIRPITIYINHIKS